MISLDEIHIHRKKNGDNVKRYLIKEVKVHEGEEPLTCSPPLVYQITASIRYETDDRSGWLHCVNALGYHDFYHSDDDVHDRLVDMKAKDRKFLDSLYIEEFDGMELYIAAADEVSLEEAKQYADTYEEWAKKHAEFMSAYDAYPLARYALALSEMWKPEDIEMGISMGLGKYADEIDYGGSLREFERILDEPED